MYDSEEYTVQQIADAFSTSRATVYWALASEDAFALIVYRNSGTAGIDEDGRPYGETARTKQRNSGQTASTGRSPPRRNRASRPSSTSWTASLSGSAASTQAGSGSRTHEATGTSRSLRRSPPSR
jgi:hypothetical protein